MNKKIRKVLNINIKLYQDNKPVFKKNNFTKNVKDKNIFN